jgi:hypothetical protein
MKKSGHRLRRPEGFIINGLNRAIKEIQRQMSRHQHSL